MTNEHEGMEDRLARLARATETITPSADFGARVMAAVSRDRSQDLSSWIVRLGPVSIPALAVLAGVLAFWAIDNNGNYEDAVMVASHDFDQDWE